MRHYRNVNGLFGMSYTRFTGTRILEQFGQILHHISHWMRSFSSAKAIWGLSYTCLKLAFAVSHSFQRKNVFLRYFKRITLKRNLSYSCFLFPLFQHSLLLSYHALRLLKTSCLSRQCSWRRHFPRWKIHEEKWTNKPSTNQDKHRERSSNLFKWFKKLSYNLLRF